MLEIYTPMAGGLAEEALNSLALLIGTNTFHTAVNIAMTVGVSAMAYQYVMGSKIKSVMSFLLMSFVVTYILLGIKFPVAIIDMQKPYVSHVVDDLPLGVAVPASFVSRIGRAISKTFDDVFHMPDEMAYNKTGMVFGNRIMLAASGANFGTSPDLSADLSAYMRQCIWIGRVQTARNLSVNEIVHSKDLMSTLFSHPAVNYHVILHDVGNVDCPTAAKHLVGQLVGAAREEQQRLAMSFSDGQVANIDSSLNEAQQYLMGITGTSSSLLIQNMMINKTRNSIADAMAFEGNDASIMNYTNTLSMNQLRITEANTFWMAGYRLPMLATCLWIMLMCLFPIIILMGFFPIFKKAYTGFLITMVYVWTWPPMFSVINFFVSFYASTKTTIFADQSGGITLSNAHAINMINSDMALTAGALALLVPFLARSVATGLAGGFASLSQIVGGMSQSISHSVANEASHGNISVDQFSGWNANYDNTNAHKHDINATDYRGLSSSNLANGTIITQTPSGSSIVNTNPAMSHLAVSVQGSQAVVSQLTQSAQNAEHRGDQLRTAADQSYSAAMRESDQFMNQSGNDYRFGSGLSLTDNYGINDDYKQMHDAIQGWNKSHEASDRVSFSQLAKYSAGLKAFGNGVTVGAELSHQNSMSTNYRDFLRSEQGQSYTHAYTHALTAAKAIHEDASRAHHLSAAEQSAVDLSRAQTLSQQANTEYSKSENYVHAASVAQSNSSNIQTNFANEFQSWAENTYGKEMAVSTLSQTQGTALETQKQWANEFLATGAGKSFVDSEASQFLQSGQEGASAQSYLKQQQTMTQMGSHDVSEQYARGHTRVDRQQHAISQLNSRQQAKMQAQLQRASHSDLMKQSAGVASQVLDQSHRIKHDTDNPHVEYKPGTIKGQLSKYRKLGEI